MEHIRAAQVGNQEDMLFLIKKFEPLLKHYSFRLYREDALSELTLAFIEIIYAIKLDSFRLQNDGAFVNYLSRSVRNAYIVRLPPKEHQMEPSVSWEELTEAQRLEIESPYRERELEDFFELLDTCPELTGKEREIVSMIYLYGYTATETAKKIGSTKQNINQIKLRALKKLSRSK